MKPAQRSKAARPRFIASAKVLLQEKAFLGYMCSLAFATSMFYSFQSGAPYLVLEVMQRQPSEYGVYFVLTALGYMLGNFVTGRYSQRLGSDRMINLALIPIATALILFWWLADTHHPLALFVPMMLLTFSNGMTLPNALSGALSVRPELAGTAAGLNGFVQVTTGALMTFIVGFMQNGFFWPLLLVLTLCGAMTAVGAFLGHRSRT